MNADVHPLPRPAEDDDEPRFYTLVSEQDLRADYNRGVIDGMFGTVVALLTIALIVFGLRGPW